MEEEKSAVDILKDIAKKEGWEISVKERVLNRRTHDRTYRVVVIKNPLQKDTFFISATTQNMAKYEFYSGIFIPVNGFSRFKLHMRNRNILDKLNVFKNKQGFKIGNTKFDSNVLVETNHDTEAHKLLSSSGIQYDIIQFFKRSNLLHIGVNENNPDFNSELKAKSCLSVFINNEWMLDEEIIHETFRIAEKLKNKLNNL